MSEYDHEKSDDTPCVDDAIPVVGSQVDDLVNPSEVGGERHDDMVRGDEQDGPTCDDSVAPRTWAEAKARRLDEAPFYFTEGDFDDGA
jgi:hypothetical protein